MNLAIDRNLLRPVASAYKEATSDGVRETVSNVLTNAKEPYYFVNYLVMGDMEHMANSLFRFVLNSSLGFFGLLDVGSEFGLEKAEASYKDTLKMFEIPTGNYLVLPILGSSSARDAVAEPISWFCDPIVYFIGFPYAFAKMLVLEVSNRAENLESLDETIDGNFDTYSVMKSVYLQKYGDVDLKTDFSPPSPD
jgi:phospholipid-binding lipoprotein MlaA